MKTLKRRTFYAVLAGIVLAILLERHTIIEFEWWWLLALPFLFGELIISTLNPLIQRWITVPLVRLLDKWSKI
ncbi:MAG: hypothetical protein OXN19_07075 [Caldilineaceae bacterium]|nr:hypothetical protein [Caldilineaceae bacterium]MDE0198788.1 hypothetical protein [Caldilineaceae bacterium]